MLSDHCEKASVSTRVRYDSSKMAKSKRNWLVALGGERVRLVMDSTVTPGRD